MRIANIECLTAYAGRRIHDFLKITLDDGLVGWSEFSRTFGGPGVVDAITTLAPRLIGQAPGTPEVRTSLLQAARRSSLTQQASAAISNALLDLRARTLDIPVHELLGGAVRDRLRLYWAHCGTYRVSHADEMQRPPVRNLDDVVRLGREVAERGYSALKTNVLQFDGPLAYRYAPNRQPHFPPLTASPSILHGLRDQLAALREGAGADVEIMLDVGSNFRAAGLLGVLTTIEANGLAWVEVEGRTPAALRHARERTHVPLASGETLRAREYHELLRAQAVDVMIVDVLFNGLLESMHVAAACEAYDLNVAVHNCYSPLATMMNAAFAAVVPNFQILERDVDEVPWAAEFVTCQPEIHNGFLVLPSGPGWGTEVDEAGVRAHPLPSTIA